ncbi:MULTISPECIES: hypothetical protein [Streptomyces]|uniref:SMI1/KNR4 family protein n=1 Tax=Streptomyces lycii TaxID=2654337 RepID=A0ABQ7FKK2_9ACTN|nr:hypothetical protein [Streptomyces lycii]KAF4409365.1 hypothetical protein GCU69_09340 [Streptomyces lycii]
MKKSFEDRCRQAIREIRDSDHVKLSYENIEPAEHGDESTETALQRVAETVGMQLPDSFRRNYFAPKRMHAQWRSVQETELVGEFCLYHLHEAFSQPDLVPEDTTLAMTDQEIMADLSAVDSAHRTGAGEVTGIRITDEGLFEVWFYDMTQRRLERMDLDYAEYLDSVLITKGTSGWQYLFIDGDLTSVSMESTVRRLKAMLSSFPDLFPDYDYAPLRARLEARL